MYTRIHLDLTWIFYFCNLQKVHKIVFISQPTLIRCEQLTSVVASQGKVERQATRFASTSIWQMLHIKQVTSSPSAMENNPATSLQNSKATPGEVQICQCVCSAALENMAGTVSKPGSLGRIILWNAGTKAQKCRLVASCRNQSPQQQLRP